MTSRWADGISPGKDNSALGEVEISAGGFHADHMGDRDAGVPGMITRTAPLAARAGHLFPP